MEKLMNSFDLDKIIGPHASVAEVLGPSWPVLVIGFVAVLIATPIARRLAFRFGILDMPNSTVKTHKQPTAYLGGVAVLAGFLVAVFVGFMVLMKTPPTSVQFRIVLGICGGAALSCVVGLIDDIKDIRPWQKLFGQAICSLFLIWAGIQPNLNIIAKEFGLMIPEGGRGVLGFFIVLFFVLGASNSLNLLDGLDGLCTGVTAIITIGFLLLEIHLATWATDPVFDPIRIVVAMALVGAALGFLVYNRHPAKIFLGDAGSILLGFIIASMMILFSHVNPRWWLASILIFGLPILDTGTALIRRALNKRPLFVSDRGHIYDQMIDRGIPLRKTVALNYVLAFMYVGFGLFSAIFLRTRHAVIFDVVIFGLSFAIVGGKGYFRMVGARGAVQKNRPEPKKEA
jgi:UDP-GlcNAc:undecaprenyl-phosphate GlcNAc-1-phosphate transferase